MSLTMNLDGIRSNSSSISIVQFLHLKNTRCWVFEITVIGIPFLVITVRTSLDISKDKKLVMSSLNNLILTTVKLVEDLATTGTVTTGVTLGEAMVLKV
jgi:hypothetical protein